MGALPHSLHKDVPRLALGKRIHGIFQLDLGGELISAAGIGDDPTGLVRQRLAQRGDVLGQVVLFHKGVGPDRLDQLILHYNPSGVENQVLQDINCLRGERNGGIVASQDPRGSVQLKPIETIQAARSE